MDHENIAVNCDRVCLSYDKDVPVLKNANLTVPTGVVYALLGPSGCGKTTLLKCALGLLKPNSGQVQIFGHKVGDASSGVPGHGVGYMPQDYALLDRLTIYETLYYFGRLYLMDNLALCRRIAELVDTLYEPTMDCNKLIMHLSGGQKRRLSLAITLVHKPRLLILDEPTVGVDPILQNNIWKQLLLLVKKEQSTVILTTHYIEEARKAQFVGFMRKGQMLLEGETNAILNHYNGKTLTDIFYILAKNDQYTFQKITDPENVEIERPKSRNIKKEPFPYIVEPSFSTWLSIVYILTWRRWVQIIRFSAELGLIVLLPIVIIIAGYLCLGTPHHLNLAIVNDDKSANLSQIFINHIDKELINIISYNNTDLALKATKKRNVHCYLHIKENFSDYYLKRVFFSEKLEEVNDWYNEVGNKPDIQVVNETRTDLYCDLTDKVIEEIMLTALTVAMDISLPAMLETTDGTYAVKNVANIQIYPVAGQFVLRDMLSIYLEFTPGAILCMLFIVSIYLGYSSFNIDTLYNLQDRYRMMNIGVGAITWAIMGCIFIIMLFQTSIALGIAFLVVNMKSVGSVFLVTMLLSSLIIVGILLGVVIGILIRSNAVVHAFLLSFNIIILIMTGAFWPLQAFPYFGKVIAYSMPMTWSNVAMRGIMKLGLKFSNPIVYNAFGINFIFIIILIIVINSLKNHL